MNEIDVCNAKRQFMSNELRVWVCAFVQMPDKREAAFDQVKSKEVRKLWEIFVAKSIAHSIRNRTDEIYFINEKRLEINQNERRYV